MALQERVGRHRVMLLSLVGWQRRRQRRELDRYADALAQLYAAVAAESGARVVVDSSKLPVTAWVLARGGAVDLSVVHLVRDSRGYAWSTRKRVPRPESPGELMPRRGALHAGLEWLAFHVLAVALSRAHVPYQRVRYEALAADPDRVVADMAWLVGPAPTAVTTTTADGVVLDMASRHSVSGNPLRFRTGPVLVEPDDAWRRDLPRPHRWLVTLVTAPGLLYFRYPLRS